MRAPLAGGLLPVAVLAGFAVGGCVGNFHAEALRLTEDAPRQRQLQTRRFDAADRGDIMKSAVGVLQDLGFNVAESDEDLGVIIALKERDATESGQLVGALIVTLLTGVNVLEAMDNRQRIQVSLTLRPAAGQPGAVATRVSFQRKVWSERNSLNKVETLDDPVMYREFFERLSRALQRKAGET